MSRTAMLAKVHIAKKQLGLDDDTYRAVVMQVTGKHSAGDCRDAQLSKLVAEFRRRGFNEKAGKRPLSPRGEIRKIYAIWGDIRPLLDGASGDDELRSFVQRQTRTLAHPDGVAAPEFLDAAMATRVIEGLKGWLARLQAAQAGSGQKVPA